MRYRIKQSKTESKTKQKKTKSVKKQKLYFIPKSIECAHRKYEEVDTHKK